MKIEINAYWGILGCLGILGYVLEDPTYYIFFVFFLFFLQPLTKEASSKDGENNSFKWLKSFKWHTVSIWLGSVTLIAASLALIILKTMNDLVAVAILLGITIIMTGFFTYMGMEKSSADERVRKIGTTAATYSWYITLVFVCFLLVTQEWAGRWHDPAELLGVTIFVMVSTMLITNTYLQMKGDVE
ncbi:hypothetical protein [Methanobacterium aggregans]|uniref:hypothetical protein n=1 Tax=Methanobacterium aggregans TaxID=1615586 RepID=UPI001AE89301|nr:hypothetical protein [Methanobacterium aggregans]MBP2046489.1 uncharacterized membrane protein YgdD (TMEM256/DUF423 family) [Methanobacterium aggregans]